MSDGDTARKIDGSSADKNVPNTEFSPGHARRSRYHKPNADDSNTQRTVKTSYRKTKHGQRNGKESSSEKVQVFMSDASESFTDAATVSANPFSVDGGAADGDGFLTSKFTFGRERTFGTRSSNDNNDNNSNTVQEREREMPALATAATTSAFRFGRESSVQRGAASPARASPTPSSTTAISGRFTFQVNNDYSQMTPESVSNNNNNNNNNDDDGPSPPNPAWAHIRTPTEFSPSMFAETHRGISHEKERTTTTATTMNMFQTSDGFAAELNNNNNNNNGAPAFGSSNNGSSSSGGGMKAKTSYSKNSKNNRKNNKTTTTTSRMSAIPTDGMEAAKIAAQAGTSFARDGGPLSAQAVLNNAFKGFSIADFCDDGAINLSQYAKQSEARQKEEMNDYSDEQEYEMQDRLDERRPFRKFTVLKSPADSPNSPNNSNNNNNSNSTNYNYPFRNNTGSPSRGNTSAAQERKEKEKIANIEKEVKAFKIEANSFFQQASNFLNQEKDEQALKKFRSAQDTYTRAIIMLESIATSPEKGSFSPSRNGTFLPTRQILGREAGTLLSNRAASNLMVIQIEEAIEKETGPRSMDVLRKYRQKIQECIDDCMSARKADATYMKPISRQAKCHERLADFTAACACYSTIVSSSKASEKEKDEARVELELVTRLRTISDLQYLTYVRDALRNIPINGGESLVQNEVIVKSAIADAIDIENRATHMPSDVRILITTIKANAMMICGKYNDALSAITAFDFSSIANVKGYSKKASATHNNFGPGQDADALAQECIVEMSLLRLLATYGIGDVEAFEQVAKQSNGFYGPKTTNADDGVTKTDTQMAMAYLEHFNVIRPDAGNIILVLRDQYAARLTGNTAFSSEDYVDAEKHYTACISASKTPLSRNFVSAILCNRAASRMGAQKYIDALLDCGRAIALDPTRAKAYSRRAAIFAHLRLFEKALEDLETYEKMATTNKDLKQTKDAKSRIKDLKAVEIFVEKQYRESAPIHARAILGFSDDSSLTSLDDAAITKAFKKLSLRAHADKVFHPSELPTHFVSSDDAAQKALTEDANRVFNFLNVAKDVLKTSSYRRSHESNEFQWDSYISSFRRRTSNAHTSSHHFYNDSSSYRGFSGEHHEYYDDDDDNEASFYAYGSYMRTDDNDRREQQQHNQRRSSGAASSSRRSTRASARSSARR